MQTDTNSNTNSNTNTTPQFISFQPLPSLCDVNELERKFNVCVHWLQNRSSAAKFPLKASTSQQLKLYGLYKQATAGDCNIPQPSIFQPIRRYMYGAHMKQYGKSKEQSMLEYITKLNEFTEQFDFSSLNDEQTDIISKFFAQYHATNEPSTPCSNTSHPRSIDFTPNSNNSTKSLSLNSPLSSNSISNLSHIDDSSNNGAAVSFQDEIQASPVKVSNGSHFSHNSNINHSVADKLNSLQHNNQQKLKQVEQQLHSLVERSNLSHSTAFQSPYKSGPRNKFPVAASTPVSKSVVRVTELENELNELLNVLQQRTLLQEQQFKLTQHNLDEKLASIQLLHSQLAHKLNQSNHSDSTVLYHNTTSNNEDTLSNNKNTEKNNSNVASTLAATISFLIPLGLASYAGYKVYKQYIEKLKR
jgi:acyl-CoA-binding protein